MIYKVYIIDFHTGIQLLESTLKEFQEKKNKNKIFPEFFKNVNITIDNLQEAMAKGRRVNEMTRVIESEDSIIIIYYHPLSRVLFCSISDADDDLDRLKVVIKNIGNRFWKKHQSDLKNFRATTEKQRFKTFKVDIENLSMGGKYAEVIPKLLVDQKVLDKILSMGTINDFDFQVAISCNGNTSSLKISRRYKKTRNDINKSLQKLNKLDIIKFNK